jgi:hypothetical protein
MLFIFVLVAQLDRASASGIKFKQGLDIMVMICKKAGFILPFFVYIFKNSFLTFCLEHSRLWYAEKLQSLKLGQASVFEIFA